MLCVDEMATDQTKPKMNFKSYLDEVRVDEKIHKASHFDDVGGRFFGV